jgi:hypothetical protein
MGTRGASEPWGRIPRSVALTRGTAVPRPVGTGWVVVGAPHVFMGRRSCGQHRQLSSGGAAGGHAVANSDPGGG